MDDKIKKRLLRTFIFCVIALILGAGVGFLQVSMQDARIVKKGSTSSHSPIAGLNIGGPFTLTNTEGEKVTEKTYDGQYRLIYFGFTYCPAICPTELQKISRVMSALEKNEPEIAKQVQPVFITVDPERDTVPVMKEYVRLFHPRMEGLTGTVQQVELVKKGYRIYSAKVEDESLNDYTVDHSSFIYLMSPDDTLIGMYRTEDTADQIYQDFIKQLKPSDN